MTPTTPTFDLVGEDEPLERQNEKLRRIAASLMRRVEQDIGQSGNAYSLFQRASALEDEVRARTRDLERTLAELNRVNEKLEAATAEAEAASRAKTRFLNAASHDLLLPLNAAKLFLASLSDTPLQEGQRQIVENLVSAYSSVETMLTSILEMSKLDAPNQQANFCAFNIDTILAPVMREFKPLADAKGLELRVIRSSAVVRSDPAHLRQIVQNLVSNAVRYTKTGRVTLGCRRRSGAISIEVHDTGPGIPVSKVSEIFREFHRLDRASADSGGEYGMGLGLAIVDRACRLLGHEMILRLPARGGASFSVLAPLAHEESGAASSFDENLVLMLSGDEALRGAVTKLLEAWGGGVVATEDLSAAAETFEQIGLPPDIVILDRSGLDDAAVATLRAGIGAHFPPGVPLIWVTGEDDEAACEPGESVLQLPIKAHRLRAMLNWRLCALEGATG